MAALKNNGFELVRLISRKQEADKHNGELKTVIRTYSVRSNGYILRKEQVKSASFTHDWGWKRYGKMKAESVTRGWIASQVERGLDIEYQHHSIPAL